MLLPAGSLRVPCFDIHDVVSFDNKKEGYLQLVPI
jgi:hypothetical protein